MTAEFLTIPALGARHAFCTRRGGVSRGAYATLNCSLSSGDDASHVVENRRRAAAAVGAPHALALYQVHGADVVTATAPWPDDGRPHADAVVTAVPGLALGIATADCAPVLFADPAGIVGAAHAGWRGAAAGVLEATIAAMRALGATAITAAIGPCIGSRSYEVGPDLRDAILAAGPAHAFFAEARPGHWLFDLGAYCAHRLAGLCRVERLAADTFADEARFFSHRRRTLAGGGPLGHQLNLITA